MCIGFIGGGRITRIFLTGWTKAGELPASIVVSDPNAEALASLKAQFPTISTTSDNALAGAADIVFVAVHPPALAQTVSEIKDALTPSSILVSLAPKFTIEKLSGLLGGFFRLARVIPNAPSLVNSGFNPVAFGPALEAEDKEGVTELLAPLGNCPEVAEEKLEIYAMLTARGPTYFWFQFYELLHFAEAAGLTTEEAHSALEAMILGTIRTMAESGLGRENVMDLIPVKTPVEIETQAMEVFRKQLPSILQQIKP